MTRTIPLKIQNEYIAGDKVLIGAAGSHNDVVLRMEFSPLWEGLTKTVQFRDALGEKTIETLLTCWRRTAPRCIWSRYPTAQRNTPGR